MSASHGRDRNSPSLCARRDGGAAMVGIAPQDIAPAISLHRSGPDRDELPDGIEFDERSGTCRCDCSTRCAPIIRLARLKHYTSTEVSDFQDFILFTTIIGYCRMNS